MVRNMNYGTKMKDIRTENLYSQEFVAEKLHIKRSTYKEYELQNSIIPITHLNEFCNYFNISIDLILGLNDVKKYKNTREKIDRKLSGKRLKEFRRDNNLTQEKLAKFLNTTHTNLVGYEKGSYIIATPYLYMICKKYNISADYLLGKIDEPKYLK